MIRYRLAVFMFFAALLPLLPVAAQQGAADTIISDTELLDANAMTQLEIEHFLAAKKSYLLNYFATVDDAGNRLTAPAIIFQAAQTHRINPKFLLALLQKEQGLIEDPAPQQSQLDWATGYACLDNQACNERWRGFAKQVNSAAEQFRYYFDHITDYNFQPGKQSIVDGVPVTPKNIVTAALYNYTPHVQGNRLFSALWQKYFMHELPDGSLVKVADSPTVWLLQHGERRAFKSELALRSRYKAPAPLMVNQADLDQFNEGPAIEFPVYALLRSRTTGAIYLLTTDAKRHITSMEVFRSLGFNLEEVDDVDDTQLAAIPESAAITLGDSYPTGAVLQDTSTGALFYVEAGRKYPIIHTSLLKANYPSFKIAAVTTDALDAFTTSLPVTFHDGALVKGSGPNVYVISNQQKRLITSESVFKTIGYQWNSVIVTSDAVLDLHPTGDPIQLVQ